MMKRSVFIAAAVLASGTLFFPPIAKATLVDFYFYVAPNAEQVVGAEVQSKGSGAGWLRLDTTTNTIEWSIVSSNLTGAPTAAHFHGPAEPGENADVRITLDHTMNPMIGSAAVDASEELELLDNLWYHESGPGTGDGRPAGARCVAALAKARHAGLIAYLKFRCARHCDNQESLLRFEIRVGALVRPANGMALADAADIDFDRLTLEA
jgi:hypothetical protein